MQSPFLSHLFLLSPSVSSLFSAISSQSHSFRPFSLPTPSCCSKNSLLLSRRPGPFTVRQQSAWWPCTSRFTIAVILLANVILSTLLRAPLDWAQVIYIPGQSQLRGPCFLLSCYKNSLGSKKWLRKIKLHIPAFLLPLCLFVHLYAIAHFSKCSFKCRCVTAQYDSRPEVYADTADAFLYLPMMTSAARIYMGKASQNIKVSRMLITKYWTRCPLTTGIL